MIFLSSAFYVREYCHSDANYWATCYELAWERGRQHVYLWA